MGSQQIPDQVRKAPTEALRAVFSGIGRMFLAAERQQNGPSEAEQVTVAVQAARKKPTSRRHDRAAAPPRVADSRWRSLDQTGNVRLLSATDLADDDDDFAPPEAPIAEPTAAAAQTAAVLAAEVTAVQGRHLPLANYDSLSLASIRARLRGLDVSQLRTLAEYERRNAQRPEVLGMFERRIEKLETGG
jgi:hypothetical protein